MRDFDPRALDRWITREPGDDTDDEVLPCRHCGTDLLLSPHRTDSWADTAECDGQVRVATQGYDEGLIRILGEEFRCRTYDATFTDCGEDGAHAPHTEVLWAGIDEYRTCPGCGAENIRRMG